MKQILEENFRTVKEVAQVLGISQLTVRRYLAAGTLKSVKIGRQHAISEEHIKGFLSRNK